MNNNYSGEEKRKFKRVKIKFKLDVVYRKDQPLDVRLRDGDKEYRATMIDISEGGMSIMTEAKIPVSNVLCIKFTLVRMEKESVDFFGEMEVRGEVRYCLGLMPRVFRLGISFVNVNEKEKQQILNFIYALENQFRIEATEAMPEDETDSTKGPEVGQ